MSTSTQSVLQGNSWSSFSQNILPIHQTGQTMHPATEIQLFGPVKQHINSKQFCVRSYILTAITINNSVTWKATMVNCYQTTWQHTPENRILHKYFRHNVKLKDEVCVPMDATVNTDFFPREIKQVVYCWDKCFNHPFNYVEKQI